MLNCRTAKVIGAVLVGCSFIQVASAEPAPTPTATPEPACSLADINDALSQDLSCSTEGTVFFGTDVNQFISIQCAPVAIPDQGAAATAKGQQACISCARSAWLAFKAAAKAKLIHPKKGLGEQANIAKIRQLCKITDTQQGDGEGDSHDPAEGPALKNMFDQLHLCLPQDGNSITPAQCVDCAGNVLSAALTANVINQQKYSVLVKSAQAVCANPRGGAGHGGDAHPTPAPTPTVAPGQNNFEQFFHSVHACFDQFKNDHVSNAAACLECVDAVDVTNLNAESVARALNSAHSFCNGTFVPHEPTPTPGPH